MKINELEWIYKNKDKLNKEDIDLLNTYNFFTQYSKGELDMEVSKMIELMNISIEIYNKYK